jgi:glycosyltransferase involved in cell wall biosynthesis
LGEPSLAFVQDWLVDFGGAERCLEALCQEFPSAPIYTLFYDPRQFGNSAISGHIIHTTFLNRPFFKSRYRTFLPLYPFAIEQLDVGAPDAVVSFSHSVAHGALVRSDTLHVCYCHTPVRYAWDLTHPYLKLSRLDRGMRSWFARAVLHYLRVWDAAAAPRVDFYVANSRHVARRIRRIYGRDARVIYPPVELLRFKPAEKRGGAYLVLGRMVPYKRADLAVVACTRLGLPLRIVGDGPEMGKLKRIAGPTVEFLGRLSDTEAARELAEARALLFCGEEDFGITPVEAMASGTPVIAFGKGGATESVLPPDGEDYSAATGLFFQSPSAESLVEAMALFEKNAHRFSPAAAARQAEKFSWDRYVREMKSCVMGHLEERRTQSRNTNREEQ